ncbi:MAG: MmgE/PrpD family protein [Burkholderiales bacterium]
MDTIEKPKASSDAVYKPAPGLTKFIIEDVRALLAAPLPDDVIEAARQSVLDWFGIAIGGADEPLVEKLRAEAKEQGGNPLATVVFHGEKTSTAYAALINGAMADALDFSDANLAMRGHTTPANVATALAMAEAKGASGMEFIKAVIAGVETGCRVGTLVNQPYLRKGFHPTGNLVPFGAAAAAAQMLGLNDAQWAHALGVAATQAAGLLASGGTMSKPFHSGKAATNGVIAAHLAKRDWIARPDALEASEGFLATHASGMHDANLYAAKGRFFILDTVYKQHAACQLTHSSIENLLKLKRDNGIRSMDVKRVELNVPTPHLAVCNIEKPKTGLEMKFSLKATAAMALLGDDTHAIAAYNEKRAAEAELTGLAARVEVNGKNELKAGLSISSIELIDGRTFTAQCDTYEPLRNFPYQRDLIATKFLKLAGEKIGDKAAMALQKEILGTEKLTSVRSLIELATKKP